MRMKNVKHKLGTPNAVVETEERSMLAMLALRADFTLCSSAVLGK